MNVLLKMDLTYPLTQLFPQNNLSRGLLSILTLLFNNISCQKFTWDLTVADATTIHIFGYYTILKRQLIHPINTFINFYHHHGYKCSIFCVD